MRLLGRCKKTLLEAFLISVESLYDGLPSTKAMKTRGAVDEKLKNH